MGTNYSTTYGALPLVPQAPHTYDVLKHPYLILPQETRLRMRGKLLSFTDSSDIVNQDGTPYARLKGRAFSFKDKHTIECLDGTPLFNVKKVLLAVRGHHEVYFGDSSDKLAADIKVLNWGLNNIKFGVFFPGSKEPAMIIKGNANMGCYYGFTGSPKAGGQKILNVNRVWDAEGIFAGAVSYELGISGNVDIGLALAIAAAIDEYERERHDQH